MSEARYFDLQVSKFVSSHPAGDGWKVYNCFAFLLHKLYLHHLLDFIRDRQPQALKKRCTANEIRMNDMLGVPEDSHTIEDSGEWDTYKELDGNNWQGIVEIVWKGQPIHYCGFSILSGHGRDPVVMVATKSNAAMRDFHHLLHDYGKERSKSHGKPHIIVANGEDMPIPKVSWDDVFLPDGMAEEIRSNVEGFFKSRARYVELGIPYRRGFLFTGTAGCGKTMSLKALANTTSATFVTVITRTCVGDEDFERAFYLANENAPAVLLIEDLDRLMTSRRIAISHFLNILDGLKVMDGILVVATANHPEELDPALLHRPSRFDRIWRFTLPNRAQRLALLKQKGSRYFSAQALSAIAEQSNGFSMAYVQEIIVNALLECAHNGTVLKDENLFSSLSILKTQRMKASKPDEDLAERERIGFAVPARRRPGLLREQELERERELFEDPEEDSGNA